LLAALERREGQIAAGQTMFLEPVLDRLEARVARRQAKRADAGKKAWHPAGHSPSPCHGIAIFAPGDRPFRLEYGADDLTP